jgi:hypothetical protein
MEKREKHVEVIGEKARGKEPLWRPRRRWVDNMNLGLKEIEWGGVVWIGLVQDKGKC